MAGRWPRQGTLRDLLENMGLREDLEARDWRARLETARRRTLLTRHPDQVQRRAQLGGVTNAEQLAAVRAWAEDRFGRLSAWFNDGLPDPEWALVSMFPSPATHYAEWEAAQPHNYHVARALARREAMNREEAAARGAAAHAAERDAAKALRAMRRTGLEHADDAVERRERARGAGSSTNAPRAHDAVETAGVSPEQQRRAHALRDAAAKRGKRERVRAMSRQELRAFTARSRDEAKARHEAFLYNSVMDRMRREGIGRNATRSRSRSRERH